MIVCKYFLNGYCKYGSQCRFDHMNSYGGYNSEYTSNDLPPGTSILKKSASPLSGTHFGQSFSENPQQKQLFGSKYNVQEIMTLVQKDVIQAEKGSQWLLSTYSPLKELPGIPGLEDYSPEELRWDCYKAVQNGTIPLWQAIVQQLYTNVIKTYNELKKKESSYVIIDNWLREGENQSQPSLSFQANNLTSIGGNNSSFSFSLPQNTQTFSTAGSIFGGSQVASGGTGSVFSSPQPASGSVFEGSQTNANLFGNSQPLVSTGVFGGSQAAATSGSVFMGSQPSSGNTFGGSVTVTGASVFGGSQSAGGSMFGGTVSPQAVGFDTTQMPPGSVFGAGSVFGGSQHSSGPTFGTTTIFTAMQLIDSSAYSLTEELTATELEAFKADRFVFGSIPTRPPPKELCYPG